MPRRGMDRVQAEQQRPPGSNSTLLDESGDHILCRSWRLLISRIFICCVLCPVRAPLLSVTIPRVRLRVSTLQTVAAAPHDPIRHGRSIRRRSWRDCQQLHPSSPTAACWCSSRRRSRSARSSPSYHSALLGDGAISVTGRAAQPKPRRPRRAPPQGVLDGRYR